LPFTSLQNVPNNGGASIAGGTAAAKWWGTPSAACPLSLPLIQTLHGQKHAVSLPHRAAHHIFACRRTPVRRSADRINIVAALPTKWILDEIDVCVAEQNIFSRGIVICAIGLFHLATCRGFSGERYIVC